MRPRADILRRANLPRMAGHWNAVLSLVEERAIGRCSSQFALIRRTVSQQRVCAISHESIGRYSILE